MRRPRPERSSFVGRATMLERLDAPAPAASILIGETGIGKSRLLLEYRERHDDATVVWTSCHRAAASIALEPLVDIIRQLARAKLVGSRFADSVLLAPERDRASHIRAALERSASQRELTLQIDDLQHGSQATNEAIAYCIDRLQDSPIRWHLAAQPTSRTTGLTDRLARDGLAERIHVDGLTLEEIRELAFKLGPRSLHPDAWFRRVHERTAGNPLYAELLLAPSASPDDCPRSLRAALRGRIDRLSLASRRVAGLLAVHQLPLDRNELALISKMSQGQMARALGELAEAELLSETAHDVALKHELIRDAAYEMLGEQLRASYHSRIASRVENPWRRIDHLVGARRNADASRALLAIGWERVALESPTEALAAFDRAATIDDRPEEDATIANAGRACALLELGQVDAAFERFAEFESGAGSMADKLRVLGSARFVEHARRAGVEGRRFAKSLDAAAGDAERSCPELLPGIMCTLGSVREREGDLDGAEIALRRGLASADERTDARETISLGAWLGVVVGRKGDVASGIRIVEDAAKRAERNGLNDELAACCTKLCYLCDMSHDLGLYEHWCRRGLAIPDPIGRRTQAVLRMNLAYVQTDKGQLREALGLCLATVPTVASEDTVATQAHCHAALLHAMLGDFDGAAHAIDAARSERVAAGWRPAIDFIMGWIAELNESFDPAIAHYRRACEGSANEVYGLRAAVGLVRCAFKTGDASQAAEPMARIRAWQSRDWPVAQILAREAEAYWRLAVGETADGSAALLAVAAELSDRFRRARLQLDVATQTGDRNLFKVLIEEFEALDARWLAERARGLARSLGLRPGRKRSPAGFLTEREAAVVNLIAGGKTNSEIGERLHISARTVEYHLSNVLGKCGLRSRVEIAARIAAGTPLTSVLVEETLA
ncbi:MAG TPA: LuxR C-terminal-related transcriptional regulator [Candidatus Eremiobacteraceae bacterium]|nr:LuxR C-terminal-related transcriptional regulator [Candidatus Eremiobacteraceae bacterium]